MVNTMARSPAPERTGNPQMVPCRALRTALATAGGLCFGTAVAQSTKADAAQWHDILYLLAPALAALIEAIADRIAGRIRRRKAR